MKRVLVIVLIGTLATLFLGIEDTSWAVQSSAVRPAVPPQDPVMQLLSSLRRGDTVEIEPVQGTSFFAVIEAIGADTVTVLRDDRGRTVTQTVAIADIRWIKPASGRKVARHSKSLIIAAVAAGLVVLSVGVCAAASADTRPVPNGL